MTPLERFLADAAPTIRATDAERGVAKPLYDFDNTEPVVCIECHARESVPGKDYCRACLEEKD